MEPKKIIRQFDSLVDHFLFTVWKKTSLEVNSDWSFCHIYCFSMNFRNQKPVTSKGIHTIWKLAWERNILHTDLTRIQVGRYTTCNRQWAIFTCKTSPNFHNCDHILRSSVIYILPNISFCVRNDHKGLELGK